MRRLKRVLKRSHLLIKDLLGLLHALLLYNFKTPSIPMCDFSNCAIFVINFCMTTIHN